MRVPISVLLVLAAGCSSSGNNRNDGSNPNGEDLGTSQSGPPETHDVVDPSLPAGIVGGVRRVDAVDRRAHRSCIRTRA